MIKSDLRGGNPARAGGGVVPWLDCSAVLGAVQDASRRLRRCRCAASWTALARGALPIGRSGRRDGC